MRFLRFCVRIEKEFEDDEEHEEKDKKKRYFNDYLITLVKYK